MALQPHDLCMAKFSQAQWDERKPRPPHPSMDHTLMQAGGSANKPHFLTKQSASCLLIEMLLRQCMSSHQWKVNAASHRRVARWRMWRVAYYLSITMGLYYVEPAVMLSIVKSQAGNGLHAHQVRSCMRPLSMILALTMGRLLSLAVVPFRAPVCTYTSFVHEGEVHDRQLL